MLRRNKTAIALALKLRQFSQDKQLRALEAFAREHTVYKAFQIARFLGDSWVLNTLKANLKDRYYNELVQDKRLNSLSR